MRTDGRALRTVAIITPLIYLTLPVWGSVLQQVTVLQVTLIRDGNRMSQVPISIEFFEPNSPTAPTISMEGSTDLSGQFLVAVPDGPDWAAILSVGNCILYIPAEKKAVPVRAVTFKMDDLPSAIVSLTGAVPTGVSLPVFVRIGEVGPYVRCPPLGSVPLRFFNLPEGTHRIVVAHPLIRYWREGNLSLIGPIPLVISKETVCLTLPFPSVQTVTLSVTDEQDRPLPLATAILDSAEKGSLIATAAEKGIVRLELIPSGIYRLRISSQEHETLSSEVRVADSPVQVKAVLKSRPLGLVKGRLWDASGMVGVQGRIFVYRIEKGQRSEAVGLWSVQTDGSFAGHLPPGSYLLIAQSGSLRVRRIVQIRPKEERDLGTWKLPRPAVIEGKIVPPSLARTCLVQVFLTDPDMGWDPGDLVGQSSVKEDGSFRLTAPPGDLLLVIQPARSGSSFRRILRATDGQHLKPVIQLPTPGSVSGVVTDRESSRPISGATVTLYDSTGSIVATSRSGPDGIYQFPIVFPGDYSLRCQAPGYASAVRTHLTVRKGSESVTDFLLGRGGRVIGQVIPPPRPGERLLILIDADTVTATMVSQDGTFLIENIPEGRHIVMVFSGNKQVGGSECFVSERATAFVVVPRRDER